MIVAEPEIERWTEFKEHLRSIGVTSLLMYRSFLRRASRILKEPISPKLLPNKESVGPVVRQLRKMTSANENLKEVKTALQRYAEFVETIRNPQVISLLNPELITPLPTKGRGLLQAIVEHVEKWKTNADDLSLFPTYEMMYRSLVPDAPASLIRVGVHLRRQGLDELNEWTVGNPSLPRVTSLIVSKQSKKPGNGFTRDVGGSQVFDDKWWMEEVRKSHAFDWSPFIGSQKANSPIFPSGDLDPEVLTERARIEVSRIIRDAVIVRKVKALHDHTCQVCRQRLELRSGQYYSEAHHLKPLGTPHNGPDSLSNLICVCPTCHVKLDYAAMEIEIDKLSTVEGHKIAMVYVAYHNKLCK